MTSIHKKFNQVYNVVAKKNIERSIANSAFDAGEQAQAAISETGRVFIFKSQGRYGKEVELNIDEAGEFFKIIGVDKTTQPQKIIQKVIDAHNNRVF